MASDIHMRRYDTYFMQMAVWCLAMACAAGRMCSTSMPDETQCEWQPLQAMHLRPAACPNLFRGVHDDLHVLYSRARHDLRRLPHSHAVCGRLDARCEVTGPVPLNLTASLPPASPDAASGCPGCSLHGAESANHSLI